MELAQALKIVVGRTALIVNRASNGLSDRAAAEIEARGLELAGLIPEDPLIAEFDSQGHPTYRLPADSPALQAAYEIFAKLLA
jgi:CO dehydrogenase maturation factor